MRMNNAFTNNKTEIDEFLKQLKIEASKPVDDSSKWFYKFLNSILI